MELAFLRFRLLDIDVCKIVICNVGIRYFFIRAHSQLRGYCHSLPRYPVVKLL